MSEEGEESWIGGGGGGGGDIELVVVVCGCRCVWVCGCREAWKKATFKPYNFKTMGLNVGGGHLHPLMKVRAEFRRVLMDMGWVLFFVVFLPLWNKEKKEDATRLMWVLMMTVVVVVVT